MPSWTDRTFLLTSGITSSSSLPRRYMTTTSERDHGVQYDHSDRVSNPVTPYDAVVRSRPPCQRRYLGHITNDIHQAGDRMTLLNVVTHQEGDPLAHCGTRDEEHFVTSVSARFYDALNSLTSSPGRRQHRSSR